MLTTLFSRATLSLQNFHKHVGFEYTTKPKQRQLLVASAGIICYVAFYGIALLLFLSIIPDFVYWKFQRILEAPIS